MTTYAFIPARAGSERVPSKNTATVGGYALWYRAVLVAHAAGLHRVWVSTDLDLSGPGYQVHTRKPEHAGPESQIEDAISDWLRERDRANATLADDDVIVLLQPTSPFRKPATIVHCVQLARQYGHACTVSLWHRREGRLREYQDGTPRVLWHHTPQWRPRSQDAKPMPYENGCVYAFTAGHYRTHGHRMGDRESPAVVIGEVEAFEIDTPDELRIAKAIAKEGA